MDWHQIKNDFWFRLALAMLLIGIVLIMGGNPRDDTDTPDRRSGLRLYTDHKTGCQYVGGWFSITPRIDEYGSPICVKRSADVLPDLRDSLRIEKDKP